MNNTQPALRQVHIYKTYQSSNENIEILKNINITINSGEVTALIGQSGSGKSTLLHIAGLLDEATSGDIFINGENISAYSPQEKANLRGRKIGFIFQLHHLWHEFSALENVTFPQILMGQPKKQAREYGEYLLSQVGLQSRLHHKPAQLSGGERQRVAIARALANRPKILLADEPTGNLDAENSMVIFDLLCRLLEQEKLSALIATHDNDLAIKAHHVISLSH